MMNNFNAGAYVSRTKSNKGLLDQVKKAEQEIKAFIDEENRNLMGATGFGKRSKKRSRFTKKQIGILYKMYSRIR